MKPGPYRVEDTGIDATSYPRYRVMRQEWVQHDVEYGQFRVESRAQAVADALNAAAKGKDL